MVTLGMGLDGVDLPGPEAFVLARRELDLRHRLPAEQVSGLLAS